MNPILQRLSTRLRAATAGPRLWLQLWRMSMLIALLLCASAVARAGDCTISASPIAFGLYDPIDGAAPVDATGGVQVDCQPTTFGELLFGVNVAIALSQGSSGSYAARTLRLGTASQLQYNLYTTAARVNVWGNGSGGTQTVGGTVGGIFGAPTPRTFSVFGRIPPGQDVGVGVHTDTITVTVVF